MKKIKFSDYLKEYLEFNNITNKDFANRIGITPKHLIDILSGKCELSSQLIDSISIVTDIPSDYIYRIELNYKFDLEIEKYLSQNNLTVSKYLNRFAYQYLIKNNWIDFKDKTDKMEMIKDILRFLRVKGPDKVNKIDENVYFKSKNDKPELLLLWLEKCYRETLKQNVEKYNKENIYVLINYIRELASREIFDEKLLIEKFNKNGIALVIQEDIPSSKIRGAFKVHKEVPAIYITYKHNRIADIYFALLHELAHCKKDFNQAKGTSLISFDNEFCEEIADQQAYDWMVDSQYYKKILSKENYNIEKEEIYPKSFVAYRLAKDKKLEYSSSIYQKYNPLLNRSKQKI